MRNFAMATVLHQGAGRPRMQNIEILVTSDLPGGMAPFNHDGFTARFHRLSRLSELPLMEGSIMAFVDWLLPEISGLEMCRQLKFSPLTAHAHITMILAEDDPEERRRALRAGADDYIDGPVSREKLLDRVLAGNQRHLAVSTSPILALGDLKMNLSAFQVRWCNTPVPLMPVEFRLLRFFLEHPHRVFTRAQLLTALGKQDKAVDERTIDVRIGRLRRALHNAGAGSPLRTVRSIGYILDVP